MKKSEIITCDLTEERKKFFGERIREARQYAKDDGSGMTQKELADILNVSPQFISQYERGLRMPKLETIERIADALHVTPAYFFQDFLRNEESIKRNTKVWSKPPDRVIQQEPFVQKFQQLNEEGREKAMDYLSDLAGNPKYRKAED